MRITVWPAKAYDDFSQVSQREAAISHRVGDSTVASWPSLLSSSHWRTPMKRAPAINTLRYAQRLADTGMDRETANVMAQALNEELEDRLLTKADLAQALAPIHAKLAEVDQRFETVDAKFETLGAQVEARFDAQDARFDAQDAKIDALDARFDAQDAKIGAQDARFDAQDAKIDALDARFDAQDAKIGAQDARFDAQDAKIDALDAKVDAQFGALDSKVDAQFGALDAKVDAQFDALNTKIDSLFRSIVFGFSMVFVVLSCLAAFGVFRSARHEPPAAPVPAVVEQPSEPQHGAGAAQVPGAAVERSAELPPKR